MDEHQMSFCCSYRRKPQEQARGTLSGLEVSGCLCRKRFVTRAKLITAAVAKPREQWDREDLLWCIRSVQCRGFSRFLGSSWMALGLSISNSRRTQYCLSTTCSPFQTPSLKVSLRTTSHLSNVGVPFSLLLADLLGRTFVAPGPLSALPVLPTSTSGPRWTVTHSLSCYEMEMQILLKQTRDSPLLH